MSLHSDPLFWFRANLSPKCCTIGGEATNTNFKVFGLTRPGLEPKIHCIARKKIEELKETFELLDPWQTCYPVDKKFTRRQTSPIKQSRIDYFLVSEDIFSLMEYTKIIPGYRTDHSAIVFSFSASPANRGKGHWKFNSQLLRDSNYIDIIKTYIIWILLRWKYWWYSSCWIIM